MSSRVNMNTLQKILTHHEIVTGRISIPASVRDSLFLHLAENTKTVYTMVDENGNSYGVEIKLQENRIKPVFMSKGGRRFVRTRNLLAGTILEFSPNDLPETFSVTVLPPLEELRLPIGVSAQTQPPVEPQFPIVSLATAKKGFRLPVGSDHPLGGQPKSSSTTMMLGFGSLVIGPDHPLGETPRPKPMELELGLSLSSVQPRTPMHMQLELGFPSGSGDPPKPSFESYMGSNLFLGQPPKLKAEMGLELCIGSGQSVGDPPKPTTETDLKLCIGSAQSMGDPPKLSSGLVHQLGDWESPKRTSVKSELEFGLSLGQAQTLPPANKRPRFSLSGSSAKTEADQPPANPEESPMLDLTLALGHHHPAAPTTPELSLLIGLNIVQLQPLAPAEMARERIKSEEEETPGLSLSLRSNFLHGPEVPYLDAAALVAGNDLQEPKPPTFLPYVPLSLF